MSDTTLLESQAFPATAGSTDGKTQRIRVDQGVTIYRNPQISPHWYIQYSLNGRQHRKSLRTTSLKRAQSLAKTKGAELVLGIAVPPDRRERPMAELRDRYLEKLSQMRRDTKTIALYRARLVEFEAFCDRRGIQRLGQLRPTDLDDFQRALAEQGSQRSPDQHAGTFVPRQSKPQKPRTVRDKLKTIRQLIKWCVRRQLLKADPTTGYDLPPEDRAKAYCWTPDEMGRIFARLPADVVDIFHFLRLTGLRVDELCWLLREDLDTQHPYLQIRHKICPMTGALWHPKHGNERIVPLCPEAQEIANRALGASPGPWLFCAPNTTSQRPGHWLPNRLWKILKKAMKQAGVTAGTTHTFRHVFCSFLAQQGVAPVAIMSIMGHGSLDIVLRYCHTTPDQLVSAIAAVPFSTMMPATDKGGPR